MIISFLTLAITGLTLKFSYTSLSQFIIDILKGAENAGLLHRVAATALFGIFITHVIDLFRKKRQIFGSWKKMLFGPDSMIPNKKDWEDLKGSLRWFIGIGERPNYGKWTYWEKFDYFAVFWGVFVIGSTGLTLWFPEFFTNFLPGWALNVATIVHSDEALLAAGFIFTVHFFNTHFRPEKFPMDTVIFSGQMSIEELKFDRPAEYEAMVESGRLESMMEQTFSPSSLKALKVFGFTALVLGLSIVIWIILAFLLNYK
jgi:cytochrome b subunit of formate dehydrogenase